MATPPPQYGAGPPSPYAPQQGPYQAPPQQGPYQAPQQAGPYQAPPQQAPPQQAGPYGPAWPQQAPAPYGPAYPPPQGMYGCRLCGAYPAAHATVRGHQGFLVIMRFLSMPGPFCRDCGLSTYRRMSSDTLWQGWWGPLSFFITPVTLLTNLGPRGTFRALPPQTGGFRPALDPGKPLWRRPAAVLFLVPALLLFLSIPALIVIGLLFGEDEPPKLSVGQCVRNAASWQQQDLRIVDCGAAGARFRVTKQLDVGDSCAPLDRLADTKYSADGWTQSCLTPLGKG
ncbi:hypothetical protein [Streptomyces goshikiensis]|uniref:LppU/SCO3897 family protein n=1 Tax=Streptomyces goshikiensis TaxID=1942 RepID=UPI002E10C1A7|nr:hypothetical protein OG224_29380 [Streptomyces goshikiensis]